MSNNSFMEEYIHKCVALGITSTKAICEKAISDLDIVDKELAASNDLRIKRKNLVNILKSFDHDSVKRYKKSIDIAGELISDSDPSYKEYLINICSFIENNNDSVSKREIMDHVGGLEQNQIVYMAIKWLCDNGILITNEDRSLSKGIKWESRPQNSSQIAV